MVTLKAFFFTILIILLFLITIASAYFLYICIILGTIASLFWVIRKFLQ